jgi:hypothetical protein
MTMVRNMHRRVHGVRPDGLSYDTRETEFFRWNYATVVWGWELADSYRRAQATPTSVSGLDQVEIAETASHCSASRKLSGR